MEYIFFVDFDGTITIKDTCEMLIERNEQPGLKEINELWERKELSTPECAELLIKRMKLSKIDIDALVQEVEVDANFKRFLSLCKDFDYPVLILSDGYDQIIRRVLQKEYIEIPFFANNLNYDQEYSVNFPYFNNECGNCGTCKMGLIKRFDLQGSVRVYIGDGTSDFCPASTCDVVFAKGKLKQFCQENNIPFYPYQTFKDVISWLNRSGNKLKIVVNGKQIDVLEGLNLKALVEQRGLKPDTVIVEYNLEVVRREIWSDILLQENDRIEIVRFVGGG